MRKRSFLTVSDFFCGAGGQSIGAKLAGLEVKIAANHWQRAIDTHQANFPDTDHDCADISAVRVERYPATDILLASPECTTHSLAAGVSRRTSAQASIFGCEPCAKVGERNCPTHSDAIVRSRATMWDVPRFAERNRYRIVIVENVVDIARWEPFEAWLMAMQAIGYLHRIVSFNSMFAHPTPQSRDRVYVVFWQKGNRAPNLDITPRGFCQRCARDVEAVQTWKNRRTIGRYGDATKRGQYFYSCPRCRSEVRPYYYAALNALDLSIKATRIGDRPRPLKERTMGRIRFGIDKYGRFPLLITTNMTSDGGRSRPVSDPAFTQTGSNLTALVSPLIVETAFSHSGDERVISGAQTLPTQSTRQSLGVAMPFLATAGSRENAPSAASDPVPTLTGSDRFGVALPPSFIATLRGTAQDQIESSALGLDKPIGTITAGGVHAGLVTQAALLNLRDYRTVNQLVSGVHDPLPTQVTTSQAAIVQRSPFLVSYYGQDQAASVAESIDTITTVDRHALVDPIDPDDWYFRMLVTREIQAGMGFPADYIVTGNAREQVKQLGNAVTPEVPNILIQRCVESLHPEVAA